MFPKGLSEPSSLKPKEQRQVGKLGNVGIQKVKPHSNLFLGVLSCKLQTQETLNILFGQI